MEEQCYVQWLNVQLEGKKVEIKNVWEDLKTGVTIMLLLEVLSGKNPGKVAKMCRMVQIRVDNW